MTYDETLVERYMFPIYILLDVSGSMDGASIDALEASLKRFMSDLTSLSASGVAIRLGLIAFGCEASVLTDSLQKPANIEIPALVASGVTRLDKAFRLLHETMQHDYKLLGVGNETGDAAGGILGKQHPTCQSPLVFVLTDGYPTDKSGMPFNDAWQRAKVDLLASASKFVVPQEIVAIGCGNDIDVATLEQIGTGSYFQTSGTAASYATCFQSIHLIIDEWQKSVVRSGPVVLGRVSEVECSTNSSVKEEDGLEIVMEAPVKEVGQVSKLPSTDSFFADDKEAASRMAQLMSRSK